MGADPAHPSSVRSGSLPPDAVAQFDYEGEDAECVDTDDGGRATQLADEDMTMENDLEGVLESTGK